VQRPNAKLSAAQFPSPTSEKVPFTTRYGADEVPSCKVSFWLPAQDKKEPIKLLDSLTLGIHNVRVQPVLIGTDLLQRGGLSIKWSTKTASLALDAPVAEG
jgi:hypothetical protein